MGQHRKKYSYPFAQIKTFNAANAVVLNRGTSEPLGAVRSSRGIFELGVYLLVDCIAGGAAKLFYNQGRVPSIKKGWETLC